MLMLSQDPGDWVQEWQFLNVESIFKNVAILESLTIRGAPGRMIMIRARQYIHHGKECLKKTSLNGALKILNDVG